MPPSAPRGRSGRHRHQEVAADADAEVVDAVEKLREICVEAGREDLASKEEAELAIIEQYLPTQLGDDDIRREIAAHFPQAELNRSRSGDLEQLVVELPDGSCATVEWSEHYFCVGSHRCTGDTLNTFIDIAEKYGAYLFDPQSGRRYGGE